MSINIRKRSGVLEPLDVNMIRKKIKKAFKHVKENSLVNIEDYLMSIRNYLKDGTSSVEISNMLIKSGLDNIQPGSFEFDSIVANLLVQDIEHRVYKETKLLTYNSYTINKENGHSSESLEDYLGETYKDYIKYGIDAEIIHPIFSTVYDDYGLKKLGTFIDPERDYLFKYIGIKTLEDRYLKRNKKGDIFELPQWRFMTVAGFLAINNKFILSYIDSYNDKEEHIGYELSYYSLFILDNLFHHPVNYNGVFSKGDIESLIDNISAHLRSEYGDIDKEVRILFASAFYDCISSFDLMTATPTLNNAGTIHHQLSSCFQLDTPDNIEGHLHGEMEKALYSKYGGGLGGYLGRYRGGGLPVDTALDAGQSVVSWLKISNDVVTTVNQLGTRPGSFAPYLDVWHPDIRDFLDMKRKGGDERKRAHDLFPAICIPDLYMKVVHEGYEINGEKDAWYLMSTYHTGEDLINTYGAEWEAKYLEYVNNPNIPKQKIKASELWKYALNTYYKDGNPFLFWRDNHNKSHALKDMGTIKSSQLCTELSQITWPDITGIKITFKESFDYEAIKKYLVSELLLTEYRIDSHDNSITIPEDISVLTDFGVVRAKKLSALHTLITDSGNYKLFRVDRGIIELGQTAVCNLLSLNTNMKEDRRERVSKLAIMMLDNVIDLNFYPTLKSQISANRFRAIAIGKMNVFNYIVNTKRCKWDSREARNEIAKMMSDFTKYELEASYQLGLERGSFDYFEKSEWKKGILPYDHYKDTVYTLIDKDIANECYAKLEPLRKLVAKALRNGYIQAPAPTGSISIITDCTSSVEGIYKRYWYEENSSGLIPVVAPGINAENWNDYNSVYDYDPMLMAANTAVVQGFTDQSISYNTYVHKNGDYKIDGNPVDLMTKLSMTFYVCWKLGFKSNYYLRSKSPEVKEEVPDAINRVGECVNCQ